MSEKPEYVAGDATDKNVFVFTKNNTNKRLNITYIIKKIQSLTIKERKGDRSDMNSLTFL